MPDQTEKKTVWGSIKVILNTELQIGQSGERQKVYVPVDPGAQVHGFNLKTEATPDF